MQFLKSFGLFTLLILIALAITFGLYSLISFFFSFLIGKLAAQIVTLGLEFFGVVLYLTFTDMENKQENK